MFERGCAILEGLCVAIKSEIYVLSIFIDEDLGAHEIEIRLGYNTESRWRSCCPKPEQSPEWPVASSASEARWNYAFWLQDQSEQPVFGDYRTGMDESLRQEWMKAHDFYFTEDDKKTDFDRYSELSARFQTIHTSDSEC